MKREVCKDKFPKKTTIEERREQDLYIGGGSTPLLLSLGKKDGKSDGSIEHHFERFFKRGYDVTIYTKLSNGFITDLVIEKDGIQQVIEFKLRNKEEFYNQFMSLEM